MRRERVMAEIEGCIAKMTEAGGKLRADISKSDKLNHFSKKMRKKIKK
jgi:hypothetical protein